MNERVKEVLAMVRDDQEKDAHEFGGKPFNGRTVAEYFGNQGAAIKALAEVLLMLVEQTDVELIVKDDKEFVEPLVILGG